jgi:hypothetical protein
VIVPVRSSVPSSSIRLGLRENWRQFSLLVLINALVGGMVGLERTVVPLIGSEEFKIASTTIIVSFIVSFGVIKAVANLVSGHLADVYGRKYQDPYYQRYPGYHGGDDRGVLAADRRRRGSDAALDWVVLRLAGLRPIAAVEST